jgi:hypothetical protein
MNAYITLLDLGLGFLTQFLSGLGKKLPANVVASVQAAIDAITAHRQDEITKAELEAQRG